jgi:hypothetical protein
VDVTATGETQFVVVRHEPKQSLHDAAADALEKQGARRWANR